MKRMETVELTRLYIEYVIVVQTWVSRGRRLVNIMDRDSDVVPLRSKYSTSNLEFGHERIQTILWYGRNLVVTQDNTFEVSILSKRLTI